VPFTGDRRHGARYGAVTLTRLEGEDQLVEVERWARGADALIQALLALIPGRFGSFAGVPHIRGTLTWTLADRQITINGRRGEEPFEEVFEPDASERSRLVAERRAAWDLRLKANPPPQVRG
jgi:hypothetical protein